MKRFTFFAILALLLVSVFPAFAQDENPYDAIAPEALEGVSVEFWHNHSGFRDTQLQAIIAVYNNPDVTAEDFIASIAFEGSDEEIARVTEIIENLRETAREYNPYGITVDASNQGSYGDIFEKMTLGLVAGGEDLPNVVVAYQNQAATYQIDNGLVDLADLVASDTYGLTEEEVADFFPAFYNADLFPTFGGARLGFPPNRSMEVLYYNSDWLAELRAAGAISFDGPPQTPDQFREAACAATENPFSASASPDVAPIGYQLSIDASRFASWTFAFGGDMFDYENEMYDINNPIAISAMEFIQGLFADGCAVEVTERFGDQSSFGQGVTLFTVGSSSGLPFYQLAVDGAYETVDTAPFQWSVTAVPHNTPEPVQNLYGASVSIVQSTPEQELATWLFIKYYTDPLVQSYWATSANYFPVRASSADALEGYFAENPAYQTAFNLLQFGKAEPPVPGYDPVRTMIEEAMAQIVQDTEADIEAILTETNEEANEQLADLLADIEDNQ